MTYDVTFMTATWRGLAPDWFNVEQFARLLTAGTLTPEEFCSLVGGQFTAVPADQPDPPAYAEGEDVRAYWTVLVPDTRDLWVAGVSEVPGGGLHPVCAPLTGWAYSLFPYDGRHLLQIGPAIQVGGAPRPMRHQDTWQVIGGVDARTVAVQLAAGIRDATLAGAR